MDYNNTSGVVMLATAAAVSKTMYIMGVEVGEVDVCVVCVVRVRSCGMDGLYVIECLAYRTPVQLLSSLMFACWHALSPPGL